MGTAHIEVGRLLLVYPAAIEGERLSLEIPKGMMMQPAKCSLPPDLRMPISSKAAF